MRPFSESILRGATSAVCPPLPFGWATPSRAAKSNLDLAAADGGGGRGGSESVLREHTVAGKGVPGSAWTLLLDDVDCIVD